MSGGSSNDALRQEALAIWRAALEGVEPGLLTRRALESESPRQEPVRIVCAGKAAAAMASAASGSLGSRIAQGLLVTTAAVQIDGFQTIVGTHPLPTLASENAGRQALAIAAAVRPGERLLCLLSGGASALMAVPAPGLTLDDKTLATRVLLREGANITELNCVRRHLSDIKGGGLARRSATGCHTLAVSDVVGDDVAVIGSGPGVPDGSTFVDAMNVIRRYGGTEAYPAQVVAHLQRGVRGGVPETLKHTEEQARLSTAAIVGSRVDAMRAAAEAAAHRGFHVIVIDDAVTGDARLAARALVNALRRHVIETSGPACVISSGETTVNVVGTGTGGRNQELALAAALHLSAIDLPGVLLSAGTDGVDGPTSAAGATVDATSVARARERGLDARAHLLNNDSFHWFEALGDLVVTGPTGTNVGDLQIFVTG